MKKIIFFILLFIFLFAIIHNYFVYMEKKVVPFYTKIKTDTKKTYDFETNNFIKADYCLNVYFKNIGNNNISIKDVSKDLIFECKIIDKNSNDLVYKNTYTLKDIESIGKSSYYIEGVDIDYSYYPKLVIKNENIIYESPNEVKNYIFKPKDSRTYKISITILNPDQKLQNYNTIIGFYNIEGNDPISRLVIYLLFIGAYILFVISFYMFKFFILKYLKNRQNKSKI